MCQIMLHTRYGCVCKFLSAWYIVTDIGNKQCSIQVKMSECSCILYKLAHFIFTAHYYNQNNKSSDKKHRIHLFDQSCKAFSPNCKAV